MAYAWPTAWYISQGDGSTTGYYAVTKRPQNTAVAAGVLRRQFTAPAFASERVFACIVAGTTANTTDATWTTTKGSKTTDGTATWIEVTGQPGVNGDIGSNCPVWVASSNPPLGLVIYDSTSGALQVCTTSSGNSLSSKPTFSASAGVTTADSSNVWTALGSPPSAWSAPSCSLDNAISWAGAFASNFYIADNATAYPTPTGSRSLNPYTNSNILSIDHTVSLPPSGSTALKAGATIGHTSNVYALNIGSSSSVSYWYGITFYQGGSGGFNVGGATTGEVYMTWDNCQVGSGSYAPGISKMFLTWNACKSTGSINVVNADFLWKNSPSAAVGSPGTLISQVTNSYGHSTVTLDGVDASGATYVFSSNLNYEGGKAVIMNSKLSSSGAINGSINAPSYQVDVINCDNGSTNYKNERHNCFGNMTTQPSAYRSGGASDGTTAISHQVITTSSPYWQVPFDSMRSAIWNSVTGSNRVVTVYGCVFLAAIPNNDDVWMEVEYLGSSGSPVGTFANTTKANLLASNAACTSDTSTWKATARQNSHSYAIGDIMQPTGDPNRVYRCYTAGTSLGSEPGAYATATDGQLVDDGTGAGKAQFQACFRFAMTVTLSAPQPAQAGYVYAQPKIAKASSIFLFDPQIVLS